MKIYGVLLEIESYCCNCCNVYPIGPRYSGMNSWWDVKAGMCVHLCCDCGGIITVETMIAWLLLFRLWAERCRNQADMRAFHVLKGWMHTWCFTPSRPETQGRSQSIIHLYVICICISIHLSKLHCCDCCFNLVHRQAHTDTHTQFQLNILTVRVNLKN